MVAAWDIQYRRIPNWIILLGIIGGCLSHASFTEISPLSVSWVDSLIGVALVTVVLLPFWITKLMGAGDVKFFFVLASWLGWKILIPIWIISVLISILHFIFYKLFLSYGLVNVIQSRKKFMPYGAYISMATVMALSFYK